MKRKNQVRGSEEPKLQYIGKSPEEKVLADIDLREAAFDRGEQKETGSASSKEDAPSNMLISGENRTALMELIRLKRSGKVVNRDGTHGVRLIYIDPPFSSNTTYKTKSNKKAYEDNLAGIDFIEFLRVRLILLRELLADNGSIYVHLDWKMSFHIKVIMDEVFGPENFLNDIIWHYGGRGAKAISGQFSRNHDVILLYRKDKHIFNKLYTIKEAGSGFQRDSDGRAFKTAPRGDYTDSSIKRLKAEGRIHTTKTGKTRIKYFLEESPDGVVDKRLVSDVWDDIPDGMHLGKSEKTGYPTQKPEALLKRIIETSTDPGDLVLDAFAGSGTTLVAAEKLGRQWIGIDSGEPAIETTRERLDRVGETERYEEDGKVPKRKYEKECGPYKLYKAHPE